MSGSQERTERRASGPGPATLDDVPARAAHVSLLLAEARDGLRSTTDADAQNGRQLDALLQTAAEQTGRIETYGASAAHPDMLLWRLRRPHTLSAAAERPVSRAGSAAVLFPVMITWFGLGLAEVIYASRYPGTVGSGQPSFFADWISAPIWRGPAMLSLLIVVSLAVIMLSQRQARRDEAAVDQLHRWAREQEILVLNPLEQLHGAIADAAAVDGSSRALIDAAQHVESAAAALSGTHVVVARLESVLGDLSGSVDTLAGAVPEVGRQVVALQQVDRRIREGVAELAAGSAPVVEAVRSVDAAAGSARASAAEADQSRADTRELAERTGELAQRAESYRDTLDTAQAPFVDATDTLAAATRRMAETSSHLSATATELRAVTRKVNWLALVADGLARSDQQPGHDVLDDQEGS